jgi:hypothetical protein
MQFPVGPNIFLSTLFSNTVSLCNCTSVLQPLDQGMIHAASLHYRSWLVQQMLANISVYCDAHINVLEAVQVFIEACKMLITTTIVNCFHKAKTVPQD